MTLEALRYILGYDIVSTIAVGSKNINQLKENVKAVEKRLEKEKIEKYEKLYNEKIRKNLLPW
jgi:aryl-alcohol dehydrogenase-like predicted oxidoreductase